MLGPQFINLRKKVIAMKKFLALLLALAMVFALAACGGKDAAQEQS